MVAIGLDKLSSNSVLYEHICLGNINKLYKSDGKCDNQQQYKDIIEAAMVSTSEEITEKISMSHSTYVPVPKPSTRKSLHTFLKVLDIKHKTAVNMLNSDKSKYRVN